jgi:hypothetical protein
MGVEIETISPGDGEFVCYILASVYILDCCAVYAYLAITNLWEMQYYHILW